MTTRSPKNGSERWHLLGVVLGLLAVAALVLHGRPAGEAGGSTSQLRMTAARTGELDVLPAGQFLKSDDLRPDRPAAGRLVVHNRTGKTLAIVAQASSSSDLPAALQVRIRTGDTLVYEGSLAEASTGWQAWPLGSGLASDVDFEVWIDPGAPAEPVSADVDWRFDVRPVGGPT